MAQHSGSDAEDSGDDAQPKLTVFRSCALACSDSRGQRLGAARNVGAGSDGQQARHRLEALSLQDGSTTQARCCSRPSAAQMLYGSYVAADLPLCCIRRAEVGRSSAQPQWQVCVVAQGQGCSSSWRGAPPFRLAVCSLQSELPCKPAAGVCRELQLGSP